MDKYGGICSKSKGNNTCLTVRMTPADEWSLLSPWHSATRAPVSSLRVHSTKTYWFSCIFHVFSDFHQHLRIHYWELQLQNFSLTLPKYLKYLLVRQQTLNSGDQILKVIKITFEILSLCAKKLLNKIGQEDHLSCSECKQTNSSHNWLKVDFDQF